MNELQYIRNIIFSSQRLDKRTRLSLESAACRLPDWFAPTKKHLSSICDACLYSNRKGLKLIFR